MQIVDYGLAIKSDNGLLVTKHLALLLRLNVMFKQKNAYSWSMFMHMLLITPAQTQHPVWQMYRRSASVFKEKVGDFPFRTGPRGVG